MTWTLRWTSPTGIQTAWAAKAHNCNLYWCLLLAIWPISMRDAPGRTSQTPRVLHCRLGTWWIHHTTSLRYGSLSRYAKLRVVHAPGTFSSPPRVSDPDMQHGTWLTHVPWCMPGSLTSSFLWSRWRGQRSRHSRRMHNPKFFVSGKRPMPS